jgi:hypothetical protein
MKAARQTQDTAIFRQNFVLLQTGCRSCHEKEDVPFIQAAIPERRFFPMQFIKND